MSYKDLYSLCEENASLTITRDSIMNFEVGCEVLYAGHKGYVTAVEDKMVSIKFFKSATPSVVVNYMDVRILAYPIKLFENHGRKWSDEDVAMLKEHHLKSMKDLTQILKRNEVAIINALEVHNLAKPHRKANGKRAKKKIIN